MGMHVDVARPSDGTLNYQRKSCQRYRPEEREPQRRVPATKFPAELCGVVEIEGGRERERERERE